MGDYTFANFKAYLLSRMGGNDSWSSYYPLWVNSAYRQLTVRDKIGASRIEIPEVVTSTSSNTSDGVTYVAVPSDCLNIIEIYDTTNDVHLDWMSHPTYISKSDRDDTAAEGTSAYWTRSGGYIWLYPTPDGTHALTIYYRKRPADLSADSDVTILGKEWDDVILELAVSIGRDWANEPDKALYARKLAETMAKDIMDNYNREEKARREGLTLNPAWNNKSTY